MQIEITCRDLHLRYVDVTGKSHVYEHRVWDADLLLAARQADARKANADQKGDAPRLARVDMIDRATYQRERGVRK